jgi:hypothetical protein
MLIQAGLSFLLLTVVTTALLAPIDELLADSCTIRIRTTCSDSPKQAEYSTQDAILLGPGAPIGRSDAMHLFRASLLNLKDQSE